MLQFSVEILLDGPTDAAFTAANNSLIIPTDTQKNTVYVLAKTTSFDCAEDFAVIVARFEPLWDSVRMYSTVQLKQTDVLSLLTVLS